MELTYAEENYLKAILKLSAAPDWTVNTNAIAAHLETAAASVTDMLKRLADKELISYQRYKGASLTSEGHRLATQLVRKHRLWETFLHQSLGMAWDEVHDIAEELEHIQSDVLTDKLDSFLGFPKFDPHGDPIPNAQGKYTLRAQLFLTELNAGQSGIVIGVKDADQTFLKHLNEKGIGIGKTARIIENDTYDQTLLLSLDHRELSLSGSVAQRILMKRI